MIRRAPRRLRFRFVLTRDDVNLILRALSKAHDREMNNDARRRLGRLGRRFADARGRLLR